GSTHAIYPCLRLCCAVRRAALSSSLFPYTTLFRSGEKLRLNLAQAMVKAPRLLLLDEPTASLDNNTKKLVKELLLKMKAEGTSIDRKSTRLNSSHVSISYAVFCLKKKTHSTTAYSH